MTIKLKYKIGQNITIGDYIMTVIGFEYINNRAERYILLTINQNKTEWLYLYEFEIEAMKHK